MISFLPSTKFNNYCWIDIIMLKSKWFELFMSECLLFHYCFQTISANDVCNTFIIIFDKNEKWFSSWLNLKLTRNVWRWNITNSNILIHEQSHFRSKWQLFKCKIFFKDTFIQWMCSTKRFEKSPRTNTSVTIIMLMIMNKNIDNNIWYNDT